MAVTSDTVVDHGLNAFSGHFLRLVVVSFALRVLYCFFYIAVLSSFPLASTSRRLDPELNLECNCDCSDDQIQLLMVSERPPKGFVSSSIEICTSSGVLAMTVCLDLKLSVGHGYECSDDQFEG